MYISCRSPVRLCLRQFSKAVACIRRGESSSLITAQTRSTRSPVGRFLFSPAVADDVDRFILMYADHVTLDVRLPFSTVWTVGAEVGRLATALVLDVTPQRHDAGEGRRAVSALVVLVGLAALSAVRLQRVEQLKI